MHLFRSPTKKARDANKLTSPGGKNSSRAIPSSPSNSNDDQLSSSESGSGSGSTPSTAPPGVMVGKSSRAPLLRLREGMLLEISALRAINMHDPPSRFPSLGSKKEGLVYLRFSFGKGLPETKSLSTARINHSCAWNVEEPAQIVVTNELAKLSGAELRLVVEAFSEVAGSKTQDILLGSGTIDLSENLNKESVTVPLVLDPKKPSKGAEVQIKVCYVALPTALGTTRANLEAALGNEEGHTSFDDDPSGSGTSGGHKSVTFDDPKALVAALASGGPSTATTAEVPHPSTSSSEPPAKPTRPDSAMSTTSVSSPPPSSEQNTDAQHVLEAQVPLDGSLEGGGDTNAKQVPPAIAGGVTVDQVIAPKKEASGGTQDGVHETKGHDTVPPADPTKQNDHHAEAEKATHELAESLMEKIKNETGKTVMQQKTTTTAAIATAESSSVVRKVLDKVKYDVGKHFGLGAKSQSKDTVVQGGGPGPTTTDRGTSPVTVPQEEISTSANAGVAPAKQSLPLHHQDSKAGGEQASSLNATLDGQDSVLMGTTTFDNTFKQEGKEDGKADKINDDVQMSAPQETARNPFGGMTLTDVVRDVEPDEESYALLHKGRGFMRAPAKDPKLSHAAEKKVSSKSPLSKDEAIERLQAAWRGKCVRRSLRIQHLQARRIQAIFRGHQDRKHFEEKRAFLLRLESDQLRREEWQRRIMRNQRELALLKATPALELNQMDQRRRDFAARRIQFFCRKKLQIKARAKQRNKESHASLLHRSPIPPLLDSTEDEVIQEFISSYHHSPLSPTSKHESPRPGGYSNQRRLSALRLSDLHKRVVATSGTKSRRSTINQLESAVANGIRDVYASRKCQSGAQARYQQLLEARYQARMLAAEYVQRPDTQEERSQRLDRVRGLLHQLENPPSLADFRQAFALEADSKGRLSRQDQVKAVPEISLPWRLPSEGKSLRIAEEAHKHALETMQEERWWVTNLPEDLSEAPVDIRHIQVPFPFDEGRKDVGEEDEASLWWYAYARQGLPPQAEGKGDGQPTAGDLLFHRARAGRSALHAKCVEEDAVQDANREGAVTELVNMIVKEKRKRLTKESLARTAKTRILLIEKQKDQAAARIQACYRGRLARKENEEPLPSSSMRRRSGGMPSSRRPTLSMKRRSIRT